VTTEQKYYHKFFKECHISCPRLQSHEGENLGAVYINNKTGRVFGVEELALTYYWSKEGFKGIHSENGLGITIFGLFMWNQIFDNTIPAVFQSPYQYAPLDYGSNEFYYNRQVKIIARLAEIEKMSNEQLRKGTNIIFC